MHQRGELAQTATTNLRRARKLKENIPKTSNISHTKNWLWIDYGKLTMNLRYITETVGDEHNEAETGLENNKLTRFWIFQVKNKKIKIMVTEFLLKIYLYTKECS